jgi:acyl carrier protein
LEQRSIKDTVVRIVADHLGLPVAALNPSSHICNDLGADSFDHAELIITIEEQFSVRVPKTEVNSLQHISDVISFLEKALPVQNIPKNMDANSTSEISTNKLEQKGAMK